MRRVLPLLFSLFLAACAGGNTDATDALFAQAEKDRLARRYEAALAGFDAVLAARPAEIRANQTRVERCRTLSHLPNLERALAECQTVAAGLAAQPDSQRRTLLVHSHWVIANIRLKLRQPDDVLAETRHIRDSFGADINPTVRITAAHAQLPGVAVLLGRNDFGGAMAWLDLIEQRGWLDDFIFSTGGVSESLTVTLPDYRLQTLLQMRDYAGLVAAADRYRTALQTNRTALRQDTATMLLLPIAYGRMMRRDTRGMDAATERFMEEVEAVPRSYRPPFTSLALNLAKPWAGFLMYDALPSSMRQRLEQAGTGKAYFEAALEAMRRGDEHTAAEHFDRIAAMLRAEDHPTATELANRLIRIKRAALPKAAPPPAPHMRG